VPRKSRSKWGDFYGYNYESLKNFNKNKWLKKF